MYTTVKAYNGERWDQVAQRAYGDAKQMRMIIDANPELGIYDRLPEGMVLVVPILPAQPDITNASLLPPWKK